MLTKLTSFQNIGLHSVRVTVEVGAVRGGEEPKFYIVGLGDTAVQESAAYTWHCVAVDLSWHQAEPLR